MTDATDDATTQATDDATALALGELLGRRRCAPGSVVVDLASGGAEAYAAVLHTSDLSLVAVAADGERPQRHAATGVEVVTGEVTAPGDLFESLAIAVGDRPVAAVWLGDLPARVVPAERMTELLDAAHRFCEQTGAPLGLGLPNVTHLDVGTKLILGRWEPRPHGVLDDAHARHFAPDSLPTTMATFGWAEVDARDVEVAESDQHFPADAVALERATPAGAQLAALRELAGPGAYVTQLVRLYEAVTPERAQRDDDDPARVPFLSVLVRTQTKREETLQETLLCLAAQRCSDFEVIVLAHDPEPGATARIEAMLAEHHPSFSSRSRVVEVLGGGRCRPLNVGAQTARGHYLATLDDDDLVFAHWVETLRDAATCAPGHVVRVGVATQQIAAAPGRWAGQDGYDVVGRPRLDYPLVFDHVEHLRDNLTPNNGYAVPRWLVTDLGQLWDETLPVLEDWDHLLRLAAICGVESVAEVAAMLRVWANAENSKTVHAPEVWEETRQRIVARHDAKPLLLDVGYVSKLHVLLRRLDGIPELELQLEQRAEEMAQLRAEIARLTDEARRLLGEVALRKSELVQLHAHTGQLRAEIARLTAEAGRLGGELARSETRRQVADEAVEALDTARADLQARLDEVFSSRSWRLAEAIRNSAGAARRAAAGPEQLLRRAQRRSGPSS
ncbi:MAG: glycosyltransferase [Acidimicrobiales bacterium]